MFTVVFKRRINGKDKGMNWKEKGEADEIDDWESEKSAEK